MAGKKKTEDNIPHFDRFSLREKRLGAGFVPLRRARLLGYFVGVQDDRFFDDSTKFSDPLLEDLKDKAGKHPDDRDARLNLAITLAQYGFYREALAEAAGVADRWPDDADARYLLGNLMADLGDGKGAEENLRKAVSLEPENPAPSFYLAELLRRRGRMEEALEYYRRAINSDELYPCAFTTLEEILEDLGREEEALEVNEALAGRGGETVESLLARARHLLGLNRKEEARRVIDRLAAMRLADEEAREMEELSRKIK